MKTSIKTLLAVAALGAASLANAALIPNMGKVTITDTTFDGGGGSLNIGGGEFRADITGGPSFYTFCLKIDEQIAFGIEFDYELRTATSPSNDVLSKGTAMLFESFTRGNLYDRDGSAAHEESAGFLQAAIWMLEDENYAPFVSGAAEAMFFTASNPYIQKVVSTFGSLAAAKSDYTDGKVKVMDLSFQGEPYQDLLVYVPDAGSTLALLGLGLAGVAIARRRR